MPFLAAILHADIAVTVDVDPSMAPTPISPLIYGVNQNLPGVTATAIRHGGNRTTGYNWETNASNAGNDYLHQSDNFSTWYQGISDTVASTTPAVAITHPLDQALAAGVGYSVVTLQMAGYVAADKNGPVSAAQAAPSLRWLPLQNTKPGTFSTTPNLADGVVYMDEFIHFLVSRYGSAATATGVKAYNLDNEPDLWSNTHPRIHVSQPTCVELIERSVDLAKAVKRVDPAAEVLGFVSYGFNGWNTFQNAPDWTAQKATGSYRWFVDYFLDKMKKASDTAGRRLLDVIDLHNYSEHRGGNERVTDSTNYNNLDCNKARIQAPRSFWDPSFIENSWIGQFASSFLPFLPYIHSSIDGFYPGTKLAITEYNFGGESHISGGIAQADTLGIFGKSRVYLANLWLLHSNPSPVYTAAAFRLYRDYDGAGGKFGDTSVAASVSNNAGASAYASIEGASDSRLHVVYLNKDYDNAAVATIRIAGATIYTRARVFAFDAGSSAIVERTPVEAIAGNQFSLTLPALTAAHVVLEAAASAASISSQPSPVTVPAGSSATFTVGASGAPGPAYQWLLNGQEIAGATQSSFTVASAQPSSVGLYSVRVTATGTPVLSQPVLLGLTTTSKLAGTASEVGADIAHPNGNMYDQILLQGPAATITADPGQITRISYIDLSDDIVQVEFSGPGSLTLRLDNATGPALPLKYNQATSYMKGHASIAIAGATASTHVSVFTVGHFTAVNQSIFKAGENYDGVADISHLSIASSDGHFGGVRTANTEFSGTHGIIGINASGIAFAGPVNLHNLSASDQSDPVLLTGAIATEQIGITGGDMRQLNARAVRIEAVTRIAMLAGATSHNVPQPAQTNQARYERNGQDVTAHIVQGP